jgi:hypothetical protein
LNENFDARGFRRIDLRGGSVRVLTVERFWG